MCPILVSSVHNFGRSDDDIIQWKNAYLPWFDAQLDQQILDGIYTRFPSDQNSSSRQMKKKTKEKNGKAKKRERKRCTAFFDCCQKRLTDSQIKRTDFSLWNSVSSAICALAHVCIFILLYFIYFLKEDRATEWISCEHSAIF